MPIHINLLAEAQIAEDMRRRDPVKRVLIGGLLIVVAMLAWCSVLEAKLMIAESALSQVQFGIDSHAQAYQTAITNNAKIASAKMKISQLQKLVNDRMLQGNLLNALQKVSVDNVQLTGVRVDQSYYQASKPVSITEQIVVTLNARDYSPNPGDQVGKFKDALARESYFQDMLAKTNAIRLTDESAPQDDQNGKGYVSFTVECHFPDKKR
jgi:hypothetical protein